MTTINKGVPPVVEALRISNWGHPSEQVIPQDKPTTNIEKMVQQVIPTILSPSSVFPSTIEVHNAMRIEEEERRLRE
jgi:hypothetical protein